MAVNLFGREVGRYRNIINQSCAELIGIAEGLLCDSQLHDDEISFLNGWLNNNAAIASEWPGDIVHKRIRAALADGVVTPEEREHLIETLRLLLGGRLDDLANTPKVNLLAMDDVSPTPIAGSTFCLTGEFVMGPRKACEQMVVQRGGVLQKNVTKRLNFLVVGGLGSEEWKHGSFGLKIQKAIEYKGKGVPLVIVHEDRWATTL